MHKVICNLLERKNKQVPIDDKRHISLILFGGAMAGIRGAGVLLALSELGMTHAFDDIYTISCGFANASYLLSNQPKLGASIYYEDLIGKKFINLRRFWKMVDVDYVVEVMRNKKTLQTKVVLSSRTKLYVRVYNCTVKKVEYLEIHNVGEREYFALMEASCSLAYFHPGSTRIGKSRYMDCPLTGRTWVEHFNYVLNSPATDILVVYNQFDQFEYIRQQRNEQIDTNRLFEIYPKKDWKLSWKETHPKHLLFAMQQMETLTKQLFENKGA